MGGKLVINLLPFTSGRIDSEETKRKTRRGKPRVSDHLGKLKQTRLSHAYLQQSHLTIGEQGDQGPRRGSAGSGMGTSIHLASMRGLCAHITAFSSHNALSSGRTSSISQKKYSFIHSFIQYLLNPLWRDRETLRSQQNLHSCVLGSCGWRPMTVSQHHT